MTGTDWQQQDAETTKKEKVRNAPSLLSIPKRLGRSTDSACAGTAVRRGSMERRSAA